MINEPTRLSRRAVVCGAAALGFAPAKGRAANAIRVGVLRFGTLNWELDTIARHGFDRDAGVVLDVVEYAGSQAAETALLAGSVDVIVQDWLWVARQRQAGGDLAFSAVSNAAGALMIPNASGIASLADLKGRTLGVAGSPIDKSWIILRAYAEAKLGVDLAAITQPQFGTPPLLDQQLRAGRLDSALNFWPFAAKEEAAGMRALLSVAAALEALGFDHETPVVGHVFSTAWARADAASLAGLLAASRRARALLASDDGEWHALARLTGAADEAELVHLRDHYRAGIPGASVAAQKDRAERLFVVLASTGGAKLVGGASTLADGVFWPAGGT